MMTSSRPRDVGGSFASRRGHAANQLSISDSSHHITETIGTLYGDDDDYQHSERSEQLEKPSRRERPLSFISSPYAEQLSKLRDDAPAEDHRLRLVRSASEGPDQDPTSPLANGSPASAHSAPNRMPSQRSSSLDAASKSPISPLSPSLREMRDEGEQFPLGDMENPNGIAQELSNLQALRRMSMDVSNTHDPDLQFQGMSMMAMPSIAPQGDDDEADPSRLLWVPAGVHPELAPTEFKNFLEKRVQSVRRRSRDSTLSAGSLGRSDSSGLSRKKSTLSRQIDSTSGRDNDDQADAGEGPGKRDSINLASDLTLDELVQDPSRAVQKLTLESRRQEPGPDDIPGDMPILPVAPGMGLRRSTRTQYRKGGSVKGGSMRAGGDRLPFARRMAARKEQEEAGDYPMADSPEAPKEFGFHRVQSEPIGENFSRPNRAVRRQQTFSKELADAPYDDAYDTESREHNYAASIEATRNPAPVPDIVHTPAVEDDSVNAEPSQQTPQLFPARSSSQKGVPQAGPQQSQAPDEPPARSSRRPNYSQLAQTPAPSPPPTQPLPPQPQQSQQYHQSVAELQPEVEAPMPSGQILNDSPQHSSALPGGSASRTDTLTFIPTFSAEEKKSEKKSKSAESSSSKSSWKWFKSDDKDKKKKDEESKKAKNKVSIDKTHDNARLDVLQSSIDNAKPKGRESLVMDRESIDTKADEDRKKESSRKSAEPKKEKDGLFANFFSSSKKKGDKDSGGGKKASNLRPVSPEPAPYRPQQPDVDYHWTRFPILEERAIYRMAHMKLANPRRALYSQVLLSNFMYAYLAKVQAMHPQIQVPISPQQKRQQEEERRRQEQEQHYMEQQNAQDSIDRYNFEYHRATAQYAEGGHHDAGDYPEDAEIYDYDHGHGNDQSQGQGQGEGHESNGHNAHYGNSLQRSDRDDDDMW